MCIPISNTVPPVFFLSSIPPKPNLLSRYFLQGAGWICYSTSQCHYAYLDVKKKFPVTLCCVLSVLKLKDILELSMADEVRAAKKQLQIPGNAWLRVFYPVKFRWWSTVRWCLSRNGSSWARYHPWLRSLECFWNGCEKLFLQKEDVGVITLIYNTLMEHPTPTEASSRFRAVARAEAPDNTARVINDNCS